MGSPSSSRLAGADARRQQAPLQKALQLILERRSELFRLAPRLRFQLGLIPHLKLYREAKGQSLLRASLSLKSAQKPSYSCVWGSDLVV